jgi:putative transposase
MHRCLKIAIKPSREIRWLCFNAGKLFNCANYLIKNGSAKPNIYDLYNKLSSNFFKLNLHSQTTTKIFSHVVRGWLNFFDYLKNPHKYPHPVKPPKFKNKKNCFHIVSFPRKYVKIDGSTITLCYPKNHRIGKGRRKKSDLNFITINTNLDLSQLDISEVNIVPKYGKFFELQIIYKKKKKREREKEKKAESGIDVQLNHVDILDSNINKEEGGQNFAFKRKMALDPGVSNFFSVVIEGVKKGFLIDGKIWKSLTTFRLRTISELKSRLDSILNKAKKIAQDSLILFPAPYFLVHRLEEKICRLWYKIAKVNEDFAHKVAKYILALALRYNVKEIVIGDGFRNKNKPSGMKDIANQLWHLAPHGKVVEYLKYLCSEHKIKVKVKDERYSSGVDSTGSAVPTTKTKTRKGMIKKEYTPERRISRGLYKSSLGIVNADINAARNIGGIRGEEGLDDVERVYLYQKRKRDKRKSNEVIGKGKDSEGSPVERVEAVAVARGSKVCMSQELIANKPSPNPF